MIVCWIRMILEFTFVCKTHSGFNIYFGNDFFFLFRSECPMIIVGNKSDLEPERVVRNSFILAYSTAHK